jgi:uncharacterized protein
MSEETLEEYIKQYIGGASQQCVSFCWHGGEPLMAGLPFFRKAMELQKKYADGKQIENTLQTNGILLNEEWCTFFRDNGFLIGLSLDGPEDIHDAFRHDCGGAPTFARVMKGVELMKRMGVEFNILSTVNARSEGRGAEVYKFLRSLNPYMQFLPVVEYVKEQTSGTEEVMRKTSLKEVARYLLCPAEGKYGIQVPKGAWHTIRVMEPSVIFEAKDGAYVPR